MDVTTLVIFLVSFVLCGALVYLVSVFGAQEKTFEEALEEQKAKLDREKRDKTGRLRGAPKAERKKDKAAHGPAGWPAKKSKGSKKNEAHDVLVPEVASPIEVRPLDVVHEPLTEESTPRSTPRSTPEPPVMNNNAAKKVKANGSKKRLVIEEVVEEPIQVVEALVEAAPVVEAMPSPAATKVVKAKKDKAKETAKLTDSQGGKLGPHELISVVKKTAFGDAEAQQLIDVLLNKQAGGVGSSANEWIDTGAKGHTETKVLQKNLTEKEAALVEECAKVKSITERMQVLRQELNQAKSEVVISQRSTEELTGRLQHELSQANTRLSQTAEAHQRDVANLQTQLQVQVKQSQTLQATCEQLNGEKKQLMVQTQAQPQVDPQIFAELEQLRQAKASFESEMAGLRGQLAVGQGEVDQLAKKLAESEHKMAHAQSQTKIVEEKWQGLQKSSGEEKAKAMAELQSQVGDLQSKVKQGQEECNRVEQENERLAEQLAEKVERPRADGEESQPNGFNGHVIQEEKQSSATTAEDSSAWQQKYQAVVEQKDTLVKEKEAAIMKLQSEISSFEVQIQDIQSELETQKAKNNELRTKNWKAMEALNSAEQSYQKLLKCQTTSKQPTSSPPSSNHPSFSSASSQTDVLDAISKAKSDSENAHKALLQRLFPEVQASSSAKSHDQWLETFCVEVKNHFEAQTASASHEDSSEVEELQKKINSYQAVLAQTEAMLTKLQDSVESEEQIWKKRMADKDSELSNLQEERDSLLEKTTALEESLKQVEEMQQKLQELGQKLTEEEIERGRLNSEVLSARKRLEDKNKELEKAKAKLTAEERRTNDLGSQVAKLNQVVSTSQEALQQEQKTIELLQKPKSAEADPATPVENGSMKRSEAMERVTPKLSQSTSSSQVGSVASLDSSGSTPVKKKSKKKKVNVAQ